MRRFILGITFSLVKDALRDLIRPAQWEKESISSLNRSWHMNPDRSSRSL